MFLWQARLMPVLKGYKVSSRSENEIQKTSLFDCTTRWRNKRSNKFLSIFKSREHTKQQALIVWSFKNSLHYQRQNLQKHFPKLIETSFLISYYLRAENLYKNWVFLCKKRLYKKDASFGIYRLLQVLTDIGHWHFLHAGILTLAASRTVSFCGR